LYRTGFANQPTGTHREDGLILSDAFITAIGRCVPPQNRPAAPELANCRPFLDREWRLMPQVRVVLALGQLAFDGCISLMRDQGYEVPKLKFGHGLYYRLNRPDTGEDKYLLASYHPSRQNTQTGKLTAAMLDDVFHLAGSLLERL
jgi:uracil-DNA glycosylase family 4